MLIAKAQQVKLRFQLRPNTSGLPILPHLLRQMLFRIGDYNEKTYS